MSYPVNATATVLVDHEALQNLLDRCRRDDTKAGLIGFNECAKHLVNLCGENIVCIYEPSKRLHGVRFRGKEVVRPDARFDINLLAVCDYALAYDFSAAIAEGYGGSVELYCPPRLQYKNTTQIQPLEQEALYKAIMAIRSEAPPSMMGQEKLFLLMELLRYGLSFPGDVLEMGVYLGGSAWYMAQVMRLLGEDRHLYLLDLFEQHMMHPNATMCADEIRRHLDFYPHVTLIEGLVDSDHSLHQLGDRPICFAHYDLGLHLRALEHIWRNLTPGAPLVLDNYGHLAADPVAFERFFARHGARVVRLPWSEQGLVFKPPGQLA